MNGSSTDLKKPVPVPTRASRGYWEAVRRHELALQWCRDCAGWIHYPRLYCPRCGSQELEFRQVRGRGTIYSHTTIRTAGGFPSYADRVPYTIVVIALDEGPRLVANLLEADGKSARIGAAVEVIFEDRGEGAILPQFRLVQ